MAIFYVVYFSIGVVIGLIACYTEKKNEQYQKVNKAAIKTLFVLSLLLMGTGIFFVYSDIYYAGIFLLLPTVAIFLTRRTFLYFNILN